MSEKLAWVVLVLVTGIFSLTAFAAGNIQNISNEELKSLLDSGVVLVDIRSPDEWVETGIVEGSHTITLFGEDGRPMPDFLPKLEQIASLATPVVVICQTGYRTRIASEALTRQIGYNKVYNVTKGIVDWIANGHPVVKHQL